MFVLGRRNRTQAVTDFGPLSEKSTSILTVEVLQLAQNPNSSESHALASRATFVDLPGMEKLHEDAESLRIKEGNSLNKGIIALGELLNNLSSADGQYVRYDQSIVTHLLKDALGGNCLSLGLVCLQNGDSSGTSLMLNYMRQLAQITNYPVVNDSKQLGLSRKFRKENIHLTNIITSLGTGNLDSFSNQISDLERQLIEGNLDKLRFIDEKTQLGDRIRELKEAYNRLVKEKSDLQEELILSEEERLQIGKALIELQIENARLHEQHADSDFDVSNKLLHAESEVLAANMREEKAQQAINGMQDKVKEADESKRKFEIESMAARVNLIRLTGELAEERKKNENLALEVINLVNENRTHKGDTDNLENVKTNSLQEQGRMGLELDRLKKQNKDYEEGLLNARSEVEQLRAELVKYDLNSKRQAVDYDSKKVELERGYLEYVRKLETDTKQEVVSVEQKAKKLHHDNEINRSDITAVTRQLKLAQRKIEELDDLLAERQKSNEELTQHNNRQQLQLTELRENFRGKLVKSLNEGTYNDDILRAAREELFRTYSEKEIELSDRLSKEQARNAHNAKVLRGLRAYARSLKHLAEDWAPLGQPLPEVLTMPPPILVEDEDGHLTVKVHQQEIEQLRRRNKHLEDELKIVSTQGSKGIERQIEELKGAPSSQGRPGTGDYELDRLRKEKNALAEENIKLHNEVRDLMNKLNQGLPRGNTRMNPYEPPNRDKFGARNAQNTAGAEALQAENERLKARLRVLEKKPTEPDIITDGDDLRTLRIKVKHYQEVLKRLEKERSELSVRATMAEEQLKNLQEHMQGATQNYQKRIVELQRLLQPGRG